MIPIHVCIIRFLCFWAHLWLHFDLETATEPAGLLQRRPCNPTYRFQDPLRHLLRDNLTTLTLSKYLTFTCLCALMTTFNFKFPQTHLQISGVLLTVQVGKPVDEVV